MHQSVTVLGVKEEKNDSFAYNDVALVQIGLTRKFAYFIL